MYAVIETGGKQYRVEEGQRLEVELIDDGAKASFKPLLVVDGAKVLASGSELSKAKVDAKVVDTAKGPKIDAFNYKNKSRVRRRWGHRQHYSVIEITKIALTSARAKTASESAESKAGE